VSDWFAIYVQSRHERAVASMLNAKEVETCLPVIHSRRAWRDRAKWIDMPAFPGYVFGRINEGRRSKVLATPGVVRIVGQGRVGIPIPEEEMEALRTLERASCQAEPWPYLSEGDRVCIKGGALDGLVGVLCDSRKQARLMVSVSLLQRSVAIEVDRDQLVPLNIMANASHM
jgi:transcription antitermination factor NusG